MKKILLAGATGNLGRHLYQELKAQGYYVRVLVRSEQKARLLTPTPDEIILGDATDSQQLKKVCHNIDVVISALGKSISLSDKNKASFRDINFRCNLNILHEALVSKVKQFMYVSAYTAEQHRHLAYFNAHANFTEALLDSRLTYTVLQPTALFSAFDEVAAMARKGMVGSLGKGDKLTNPIYEGDLAKVAVAAIGKESEIIPVGGQKVYSRLQLLQLASQSVGSRRKIPTMPLGIVNMLLPLVKLINRNMYDKLAFMVEVSKKNCVAPQVGAYTLEEYFDLLPKATV